MTTYTDSDLLDWLQAQTDKVKYTGKVMFRWSTTGRGWRLHETSWPNSRSDVRRAIADAVEREKQELEIMAE